MKKAKHRRAKKNAPSPPLPRPASPAGQWLSPPRLLALCGLTLAAAFAALLGGISDGSADMRGVFDFDSAYPPRLFAELVDPDAPPLSGWLQSNSPMWFPELFLFSWPLYAAGFGWVFSQYAVILIQTLFGAAGWMLVCARLGGSRTAQSAALLAWAAPLAFIAYGEDVFFPQARGFTHLGVWIASPWLLWLALPNPAARDKSPLNIPRLAAMTALLAALSASDPLIIPWFVAPAAAAAVFLFLRRRWNAPKTAMFLAALALGVVAGISLGKLSPLTTSPRIAAYTSFNPAAMFQSAQSLALFFARLARESPLLAVVWIAFAVRILVCLCDAWRAKSGESAARIFAAAYLPSALACPLLAVAATGTFSGDGEGGLVWAEFRYFIPAVLLPLFAGWVVPPVGGVFSRPRRREHSAVAVLALALAAASVPKIAAIAPDKLSPFQTPFHLCASAAAKERGWRSVAGGVFLTPELILNPHNGIDNTLDVVNPRSYGGQFQNQPLFAEWAATNRHWYNGAFDFVVVNARDDRIFGRAPREQDRGCPPERGEECIPPLGFINAEIVRDTFGEPDEIVECAGIALFGYDPPVRVDMSHIPDERWNWIVPLRVLPRESRP